MHDAFPAPVEKANDGASDLHSGMTWQYLFILFFHVGVLLFVLKQHDSHRRESSTCQATLLFPPVEKLDDLYSLEEFFKIQKLFVCFF